MSLNLGLLGFLSNFIPSGNLLFFTSCNKKLPLIELQDTQANTQFSQVVLPPLLRGIT
jgi:hypothetical protein